MGRFRVVAVLAIALAGCASRPPAVAHDAELRPERHRHRRTHNSYKQAIDPKLFAFLMTQAPKIAPSVDYSHTSLTGQLDDGARAIEIDVAYDPKGGLFAHPMGPALMGEALPTAIPNTCRSPVSRCCISRTSISGPAA